MYKICFYVPVDYVERVKNAMFNAGAGKIGNYQCCSWQVLGKGQCMPVAGSNPFIGERDKLEKISEYKVELVCQDQSLTAVIEALKRTHPYEEPAFQFWKVNDLSSTP